MRTALLLIATLAIASAFVPESEFAEVATEPIAAAEHPYPKQADLLLQAEREEMFAAATGKVEMSSLLQVGKKGVLQCSTRTRSSNNAGVITPSTPGHYAMTGGGMVNNYRSFNKLSGFEEMYPRGNAFSCDTGFGPGRLKCYSRVCKTNVGGLSCVTRSLRFRGSGVRDAKLPSGFTMTGGGIYNHYRGWNARAGFEESRPNGNHWRGDMGFGWGDYTVYVRGCKAPGAHKLKCVTRHSGVGNYNRVSCPSGYTVTGCVINNHYRHYNHLSGFEASFSASGSQCHCDTGFGTGRNTCYARCCKIDSSNVGHASCVSNAKKGIAEVIHNVKNAQGILNRMDNGSRCASKGQAAVKSAQVNLQRKQAAEKAARKALNKALNARISVSVVFSSGNRNCGAFTNSAEWQRARRNKNRKQNALTKAKQQVRDAQKYLQKMKEKAASDRCKFKARVMKAAQNAVIQARKLTAERKRSIIRELMVICLANAAKLSTAAARNNAGNRCKSQGLPAKYNNQLALHQTKLVKFNFKCDGCMSGRCTCRGISRDKNVYVNELNQCLRRVGAQFYRVQWIEVAYGKTSYLTHICQQMFGSGSRYKGTIGGDRCSSSAYMYPSYCGQGWKGRGCSNGCGNANYAGFRCT